ncbi:MAG: adenylate kinase [Candidatus Bathyarchaeota archaeon]|nr:adenylate kinase [Candidatus Bathyarchaeota archaeon]MDH5532437.1 adenylate kinase [Candidatus Bathyarchaeota archaeon]MDH5713502.1 adenylate kinase [Candidatus Bathyarchaeota archaeon]
MNRVVIVTGIPGTGKTTVCNELLELAEGTGRKVAVINFGTVMVELSRKRDKSLHRDELRKSKLSFQRDLQAKAAKVISQKAIDAEGDLIVDTHMSIKTLEGYWAGLPIPVLKLLNPEMLVLVEAEPLEVLSRRVKDPTRRRDKVLEDEVAEELLFSRLMAAACSVLTGASVKIVKNPSGKQVDAAKEVLRLLG